MKSKIFLFLILLTLSFFGCSAPSVFYLRPAGEEFHYDQGREVVSRSDSVATTFTNFEYQEGKTFSLYAEISNNSSETFLVDPSLFYVEAFKPENKFITKYFVIDPEEKISLIQEDIINTETSKESAIGVNIFLGLINTVADIESEAPVEKVIDDAVYWGNNAYNEAIEYDIQKENLQNMKSHWVNNVLRKTTLAPGEFIGGLFYIPIQPEANLIILILPIGNTTHKFVFQQKS